VKTLRAAVALFLVLGSLNAMEKYWVAHEATLIVVGTLHPAFTFPWFDGWHVTGTIVVDEVLYGNKPGREIKFRYLCNWPQCRSWPPPQLTGQFIEKGLWFLRSVDRQTWDSSLCCGYLGFGFLSERPDFENYIRQNKH